MNGILIWWISRTTRERTLLVLALITSIIWSSYNYGWLRYADWQQQLRQDHERVIGDQEWLELIRGQLYDLHREGKALDSSNFEVTVRQVLAEYASTTQLSFAKEDDIEVYQMRWRGDNPDRFVQGLQKLGQLGGSTQTLRLRRGRNKQSEAYAEVVKR